jgi:hypothetical protein
MPLSAREEVLLEAFRRLPPDAAEELSALAQRLAALAPGTTIDWSDSWSDDDLQEFSAASLRRARGRRATLKPGDVVIGMLPGAAETKVRPAVVIASETYLVERPDVLVGILTTKKLPRKAQRTTFSWTGNRPGSAPHRASEPTC